MLGNRPVFVNKTVLINKICSFNISIQRITPAGVRMLTQYISVLGNIDKDKIKVYFKKVKKKLVFLLLFIFCIGLILYASGNRQDTQEDQTEYMSKVLTRSTEPLGLLKENPGLERYLSQSGVKWAVRAGKRHILN